MTPSANRPAVDQSVVSVYLFIGRALRVYRKMIMIVTGGAILAGIIFSLLIRPVYHSSVVITTATENSSSEFGGIAAQLGELGDIAGIGGLQSGPGASLSEALAVLQSRDLTYRFFDKYKVLPQLYPDAWDAANNRWKPPSWFARAVASLSGRPLEANGGPSKWDAFKKFDLLRTVVIDRKGGVVILGIDADSPAEASDWANDLVRETDALLRQRTLEETKRSMAFLETEAASANLSDLKQSIYSVAARELNKRMLASVKENFAIKVLDPAVPPQEKSWPKRGLIVILCALAGGFFSALLALFLLYIGEVKAEVRSFDRARP